MKIRVLAQENNDNIRIGAALEFEEQQTVDNLAVWVAEQYGVQAEDGKQPTSEFYQRIAIVDSNDLRVIKEIYTRE